MSHRKAPILFLRGIFPEQCETVTDKFRKHVMQDVVNEEKTNSISYLDTTPGDNTNSPFNTIPEKWVDYDSWITSTNLRCCNCTLNFKNKPHFILGRDMQKPIGNFCTANCAETWIDTQPKNIQWELRNGNKEAYYLLHRRRVVCIPGAPCKEDMKQYGGSLTSTQFIKKLKTLEALIR